MLYRMSRGGRGLRREGEGGEKVQCSLPASPRPSSTFHLRPGRRRRRRDERINSWRERGAAMEDECGHVPPRNDVPDSSNVVSGMFSPLFFMFVFFCLFCLIL